VKPQGGRSSDEGWEYFEVAADVGVHAWGPDLAACFRQCGLGVLNLIVSLDAVRPDESREVNARGETPETLLVNWVNELLYLHDVEGFVAHDLARPEIDRTRLQVTLTGEPVDPRRHPRGTVVKAATFHGLALEQDPGRVSARLILDI
jgi:SHS2 domain-containing protein